MTTTTVQVTAAGLRPAGQACADLLADLAHSRMIRAVRVRDLQPRDDGVRYLVDRLWPRGVRKSDLDLTGWAGAAAPSHALRSWFGHDAVRWDEFRSRYVAELDADPASWRPLLDAALAADLLLLYAASDPIHNNAVVLRDYLYEQLEEQADLATGTHGGGDPACWLARTCHDCGAVHEHHDAGACPRGGAAVPSSNRHVDAPEGKNIPHDG